ncbi:eukaryotic translation initiation factor eIF2A-domain-containing protein [Zopfochytrium polystomum]|nr:eukaryotic translation initiation factor eIF2A-domain-containing protein [Zopfochytrium polystomum]
MAAAVASSSSLSSSPAATAAAAAAPVGSGNAARKDTSMQLSFLTNTGISVSTKAAGNWSDVLSRPDQARSIVYSPDGKFLALIFELNVEILDARTIEPVSTLDVRNVIELAFSPLGSYVSTWIRYVKPEGDNEAPRNLSIWNTRTAELVAAFPQKNQASWNVQWVGNESLFAKQMTNEVQFFNPKEVESAQRPKVVDRLKAENLKGFSISPNKSGKTAISVFIGEKKGSPASVKLFDLVKVNGAPIGQRTFFNADSVDFLWSVDGLNVLAWTHTEVDSSNQSYYGKSSLHYLSMSGNFDCRVDLGDGPIHAVNWSPNSKEFIVIHGVMPAQATLFDHRANAIYNFPSAPRNSISYSPHGRFIAIGGFGNLRGDVDIWDRLTFNKLATIHADNCSVCEWAPDGRHLLTATLYKRLKVDNGLRVWHYSGALVHRVEAKEMYQVTWRYDDPLKWPKKTAALSPPPPPIEVAAAPAAPKGVYRPPGARGRETPSFFSNRDEPVRPTGPVVGAPTQKPAGVPGAPKSAGVPGAPKSAGVPGAPKSAGVPGAPKQPVPGAPRTVPGAPTRVVPGAPTKAKAKANKKQSANGNSTTAAAAAAPAAAAPPAAPPVPAEPAPPAPPAFVPTEEVARQAELEKKVKSLNKKLKQINEIKGKKERGEPLELTQLTKMENEEALRKQLEAVNLELQSL